jgi:hypothetical protein
VLLNEDDDNTMIQFNKQKKNMNEANMKNKYVDDDDGKKQTNT